MNRNLTIALSVLVLSAAALLAGCSAASADHGLQATAQADNGAGNAAAMAQGQKEPTANARCPIMGSKIDPNNVPDRLTRQWQGTKIGFCCPACPPAWDKLSDEQKQAKLDAVMAKS